MDTIANATTATTTPTTPQITDCLACFTFSGSPCAVANKKPANTNMITKKATATGHRMPKKTSIRPFMVMVLVEGGMGPGSNAKIMAGNVNNAADTAETTIFLFIFLMIKNLIIFDLYLMLILLD